MSKKNKKSKTQVIEVKDFGTSDAYADNIGWTSLLGGPYGQSHTGLPINPVNSMQVGAIYSCVSILCGDLAKLPLRLMEHKNDIWIEDTKHPIAGLLRRPNKRMTQAEFTTHIVMSLLLTGNSFVAVIRDKSGRPISLIPLIPNTVSLREDYHGNLFYTCTNRLFPGTNIKTFDEDDMVHIRSISLDGGIRGASIVQLVSETIGIALATNQLAAEMFKNGAHFQGILTTDQVLGDQGVKQAVEQFKSRGGEGNSGLHNAYKTPLMQRGIKFQPVQQDAQQLQMLEARRLIVEECARLYKIPLYKLSTVDKMGYNSIDAQAQDYIDTTLVPLANPIEQSLAKTLLELYEFDNYKFEFDFNQMERGDIKTRTEFQHQMMTDGVFSVNEVRHQMNMKGIGPEGDIRTKPVNTGVVGDTQGLPMYQIDAPFKESETESVDAKPAAKPKVESKE